MAYSSTCFRGGSLIGSRFLKPSTSTTTAAAATPLILRKVPFSVHITTTKSRGIASSFSATASSQNELAALVEAPSCIFVGPLETASQETLEALYIQARNAYYSGKPLIVDDMFDRVELKLRRYGSKSVVKYPRCSLRRHVAYADAEEDLSQAFALASIWILFLAVGCSACLAPIIYIVGLAFHDTFGSELLYSTQHVPLGYATVFNGLLFALLGSIIGYPIAKASVGVLLGLWRNDLASLRGACPNCGEEVFAFVRSDQSNSSPHRADCHVCECSLLFRTKAEKSVSKLGRWWVYGRIYLVSQRGRNQRWT